MLSPKELKIVVGTLSKRRAWLKKSLEEANIDANAKTENTEALTLLDSAIQKLSSGTPRSPAKHSTKAASSPLIATPESASPVALENARLLVAEDNEDSATLLMDILQDLGIRHADLARDGKEAFDKIKSAEAPYHIILCDWDMPELTGLEVHAKAKASNTLLGAHFVMVTAVSEATRIKQAVQQGINGYIVKPIDIDKLEAKIKSALRLS